ncbi:MAG: hypothetical protein ACKOA9_00160 [Actinomycetota bacterium]
MARRPLIAGVVALALVCSACAVDTTVTVRVDEDGAGVVRVEVRADADAVQTAEAGGGTLESRVRLADLPAAGWTVGPWVRAPDGSASITLRKRFADVDEVTGILSELSGDAGPLRDASFTRSRSFLATETAARVTLDRARMGTGIAADSDLVARLQAEGVDVNAIDQQLRTELQEGLGVRLVVELPDGSRTVIEPAAGKAAALDASASVLDLRRLLLLVAAVVLVGGAFLVAVWPRRPVRRHRHEPTYATYRRGAAQRRPLSREEATRERTPRESPRPPRPRRR